MTNVSDWQYYKWDTSSVSGNSIIWSDSASISWTGPYYTNLVSTSPVTKVVTKAFLEDLVQEVREELTKIDQRFRIFDPNFALCEVLAAKMLATRLPKGSSEFGLSEPLPGTPAWPDKRRNTFIIVTVDEHILDPQNCVLIPKRYIVDICAAQHGGNMIEEKQAKPAPPWAPNIIYKNATSLVKRLFKEGRHSIKEVYLKDAIALSTRYAISDTSPSQLDAHQINPQDDVGRKFLEKFGKDVGFKTTLAQLLLDNDPNVAKKALEIAQIILAR